MNRRSLMMITALLAFAPTARAETPEIFTGLVDGVGAGGYDVVSYFAGTPTAGQADMTADFKGAKWRFSSKANLEAFKADPAKYTPQFGGYCAYGVAKGYAVKGEPGQWTIVDGKLYLNYSAGVQKTWKADIPGNISAATANWPKLLQ